MITRLPLPAGSRTSICECSHDWCMHGQSGWTSRSAVCHGWTGNATPGPYEPCQCAGFQAWNGLRDPRTGEPVRPLAVAVDARAPDTDALTELYLERAHLVALLSTYYPSVLAYNDPAEPDWAVCYVGTPAGQLSWHIAPDDMHLFDHLCVQAKVQWDGHSTEEKYERVRTILRGRDKAPRLL